MNKYNATDKLSNTRQLQSKKNQFKSQIDSDYRFYDATKKDSIF